MKKFAISLFALAASGFYVWAAHGPLAPSDDPLAATPAKVEGSDTATGSLITPATKAPLTELVPPETPAEAALLRPAAPTPKRVTSQIVPLDVPAPRIRRASRIAETAPRVTQAAMTVAAGGGYADGTYTGPAVDAYYGEVQIQATVQGGQLTGIKVLRYPNDRRTSIAINRQALPMLRDEVISAQSASVDIISGATLTSEAFIESLTAALRGARA